VCNQYEVFGLDFMLDEDFKVYLIECNTNPALDTTSSPLLNRLIPNMIEDSLRIAVDPLFPPNIESITSKKNSMLKPN
jgi:tubulin monoglycylase TTLL3/8